MTIDEFSNNMDVALNSYSLEAEFGEPSSKFNIVLDEYEKSVFLTKAQNEIFINLYNGKNIYGDFFEGTEEIRRYLDNLVITTELPVEETHSNTLSDPSYIVTLPLDLAFITLEQVIYASKDKCINGLKAKVYPVTQDEYDRVKDNPFRGPSKYKAIRLDYGNNRVELISKYPIAKYILRYLKKPKPIVLIDLPDGLSIEEEQQKSKECELNPLLHDVILDRAIALALQSKSIVTNNQKTS